MPKSSPATTTAPRVAPCGRAITASAPELIGIHSIMFPLCVLGVDLLGVPTVLVALVFGGRTGEEGLRRPALGEVAVRSPMRASCRVLNDEPATGCVSGGCAVARV